jgi:putative lysine transport system permease protein
MGAFEFFTRVSGIVQQYWPWFLTGTGTTVFIAFAGTAAGFLIGLVMGVIRTIPRENHKSGALRKAALTFVNAIVTVYIEVFRGTPMIVQAMVIYYGMLEAFGLDLNVISASFIIVSVNTGAYMSEVIRGGIQSVDSGQTEAAHAIGMNHWQTMRCVVLPQAIRNVIPATGNEFIINIKDTSVLNVISLTELFFMTKSVKGATFLTYESFLVAGAIYLFLTLTTSWLLRKVERRLDGPKDFQKLEVKADE